MSQTPLVSVVIPAYNVESVLAETIVSAQRQTHSRIEIIVVDDGSKDRTGAVAAELAASDSRIKCLRQENAGPAAARNAGLKIAGGEWIAFLDGDDVWFPAKIENQLRLAGTDPRANLIFANYFLWNGIEDLRLRYEDRKRFPDGDVSAKLFYWNLFCPSSVMVKRESLDRAGPFDIELFGLEDWDMWLRIAEQGMWARGLWEPQLRRRFWGNNISGNKVRETGFVIRTMEKALARQQSSDRAVHYRRSLRIAKANAEFAKARAAIDSNAGSIPDLILRAWRHYPARLKWLLWYACVRWPASLGGNKTANIVYKKLRKKW